MSQLFPDAPPGLGRMMTGGAGKVPRAADDFYPTPAEVTVALLEAERARRGCQLFGRDQRRVVDVWEPCAGDGAIVSVLSAYGFSVTASDINPRAAGIAQASVFADLDASDVVITNPPFGLAAEIIDHLLFDRGVYYLALLLKAQFWHAAGRQALFERHRPTIIYPLLWRPDFLGGGAPTMDCLWTVWEGYPGPHWRDETRYRPLPRPQPGQEALL